MFKRTKSWEIILTGLAFIAVGIYLMSNTSSDLTDKNNTAWNHQSDAPNPPLPGAIVIDLQDLESLKNLDKLRHLKDWEEFEQLEFEIKNIDKLIQQHTQNKIESESLDKSLAHLEKELQKIEHGDFAVSLKDKKLYINKNYDIGEAQWTEVDAGVFIYKDTFSTSELKSLDFNTDFGNVNIVGNNSSTSDITLQATGNINNAETLDQILNIEKTLGSRAEYNITSTNNTRISTDVNLEVTLSIPQNLAVNTKTSGGHITASNLNSNQQLNTSGGHITLTDLSGTTSAQTSGGHITSNRITGDIKMSTGGGHIKVDQLDGALEAKTGGGHIEIQKANGSISAKTSGGNISSTVQSAKDELQFSTSAGNISLTLPSDLAANLEVSATSIDLDETLTFSGEKSSKSIEGTLNGGGVPITINCGYGNVTINANN